MSGECALASSKLVFIVNIFLHVIILFGFLTVFFNFFITKVMKSAFNDELGHIIENNLKGQLDKLYSNLNDEQKKGLKGISLDKFERAFQQPSKHVDVHNKWIQRVSYAGTVTLCIMLTMLMVILSFSCNTCIPFMKLLKENLIVFAFVGVVEFLFFTRIAMKFIPAPPSLMVSTFIDTFKNEFR